MKAFWFTKWALSVCTYETMLCVTDKNGSVDSTDGLRKDLVKELYSHLNKCSKVR